MRGFGQGAECLRDRQDFEMTNVVVVGSQWGDEGKGKMVDMLATTADVVCRCQVSATSIFGGLKVSRAPLGPENPPLVGVADLVM